MRLSSSRTSLSSIKLLALLSTSTLADDVLQTNGFTNCIDDPSISVQRMDIQFDRTTNTVNFDVAGSSTAVQNVTATLEISAYGESFSKPFDPCGSDVRVSELCPVPQGTFAATGSWVVPPQYASQIPSIAYNIPDLDGNGKVELKSASGQDVACVSSNIGNSKTTYVPAISYAAAAIAGAALVVSGLSALSAGAGGQGSSSFTSPSFTETFHWFQGMAMNGMMSVQYPGVYRDFSRNFAFSTGVIPWNSVNVRIDNFRASTGGNLTADNVQYLHNATLVYQNTNGANASTVSKRSLVSSLFGNTILHVRDGVTTNVNGTSTNSGGGNSTNPASGGKTPHYVQGITAYVEQLMVPKSNTFMLALLIFAIVLAGIIAGILLFKVILEAWSLFGRFPPKLAGFRKNYWWTLSKAITNTVMALYSVLVLYCIFQFKIGDSWAARVLAGITLILFTSVLFWFTWRIFHKAHQYKKLQGDNSILYDDKETWRRYSQFYDTYKRSYYWLFVPVILYMFARGTIIAAGDGHGIVQVGAQMIVDSGFLVLLLFMRPYNHRSANWINIIIQIVRVLSVVMILVFVEELGVSQTTKTVTGWALVIVQGTLTLALGILISINALVNCIRANPHRLKRKEAEKLGAQRDEENLTSLDPRNTLLMCPVDKKQAASTSEMVNNTHNRGRSQNGYDLLPYRDESSDGLVAHRGAMASVPSVDHYHDRSRSISPIAYERQPQLPDLEHRGGPGTAL